jgi:aerobic carbon-monoxide dehydrogenase small subunit
VTDIDINVNARAAKASVEPRTHLADFLRDHLNLTGTHLGCEHGVCGACTLLIDGMPARSCITFAAACDGARITTIEGLDNDEIASELRAAFTREHALQCGYCTPGMLISARDLVLRLDEPDERAIRVGHRPRGTLGHQRQAQARHPARARRRSRPAWTRGLRQRREHRPRGDGAAAGQC